MTISQALNWMKMMKERHKELISLRDTNAFHTERLFGEKQTVKQKPTYDVKKLDKLVSRLAMGIRNLDEAIKDTNTSTEVKGFKKDEAILGEVE